MDVWKLLGSHRLAAVLLLALAVAAMLGGTLPQAARLDPAQRQAWQQDWSATADWLTTLRLSDVFGAPWFWGLCLLLLLNLAVGMTQLLQRRGAVRDLRAWAVLVGHGGISLLILAGMGSALGGFGAHLELTEGEVYEGAADKLVVDRGHFPGFAGALRLDAVTAQVTQGRYLRELQLALTWLEREGMVRQGTVSANRPLVAAGYRIYPDNTFGHSAVLDRFLPDGRRGLVLMNFPLPRAQWGATEWRAEQSRALALKGGENRHFRMVLRGEPVALELQVSRGAEVLFDGVLRPGEAAQVGDERFLLRQVSPWAGLYLAADPAAEWAFAGMLLALTGFALYLLTGSGPGTGRTNPWHGGNVGLKSDPRDGAGT